MKKIIGVLVVMMASAMVMQGQQDPHFTMYMFNKQVINPGYSGSAEAINLTALFRKQWVGIDGAPATFNLGLDMPLKPKTADFSRIALGGYLFQDNITVFRFTGAYAQYVYRIPLSGDNNHNVMALGLQGGVIHMQGKLTELSPVDKGDPNLQADVSNALLPNVGFGVYFYGDRYYLGASVPHLIQNRFDKTAVLDIDNSMVARQYRHYFAMAGYIIPLGKEVKLLPSVIGKAVSAPGIKTPLDADISLAVIYQDRVLVGGAYRLDDSFDAMLRFQATKHLGVGYAFDFTISELNKYSNGSHEFMLSYDLGHKPNKFTTPRFIRYY